MNWKWLIPIWGIEYLIDDDIANLRNDYMRYRLPVGLLYHLALFLLWLFTMAALLT